MTSKNSNLCTKLQNYVQILQIKLILAICKDNQKYRLNTNRLDTELQTVCTKNSTTDLLNN